MSSGAVLSSPSHSKSAGIVNNFSPKQKEPIRIGAVTKPRSMLSKTKNNIPEINKKTNNVSNSVALVKAIPATSIKKNEETKSESQSVLDKKKLTISKSGGSNFIKPEGISICYSEETKFRTRYQRNNKRGGLKNLRCFPICGECHKERGFCGRSVIVKVTHQKLDKIYLGESANNENGKTSKKADSIAKAKKKKIERTEMHKYMCRAEFVKLGESGLVKLGDVITREFMAAQDRSKHVPTQPWVEGELMGEKSSATESFFEFNKDRKGWHYGWASNKHTCNAQHCLLTYVFERLPENELKCIDIVQSSPFMLYCRRRRRFVTVPTAPIAETKKKMIPEVLEKKRKAEEIVGAAFSNVSEADIISANSSTALKTSEQNIQRPGSKNPAMNKRAKASSTARVTPKTKGLNTPNPKRPKAKSATKKHSFDTDSKRKRNLKTETIKPESIKPAFREISKPKPMSKKRKLTSSRPMDINRLDAILSGVSDAIADIHLKKMDLNETFNPVNIQSEIPDTLTDDTFMNEGFGGMDNTFPANVFQQDEPDFFNVSNMELDDFSKSISDCIDQFSLFPELDLNLDDPVFSDDDEFGRPRRPVDRTEQDNQAIIEDLAKYLLHEKGFTNTIHKLTSEKSGGASYQGFLDVLQSNLEGFMRKHNLTVEEFDRLFGIEDNRSHSNHNSNSSLIHRERRVRKPQGFFGNICEAFVTLISPTPPPPVKKIHRPSMIEGPNSKRIPNHSGVWKRVHDSSDKMTELRKLVGIPWILSKMLDYMESHFEISQQELEMDCKLRRKLLSNGSVRMTLDGVERPFGLKLPILSSLSRNWTCQAFCSGETVTCIHNFGQKRLTRVSWLSRDENILHSRVILETYDDISDTFIERMQVQQTAVRQQ